MYEIKLDTKLELVDNLSTDEAGEAFASVSLNPTFQWAKIVITDDQPNANGDRVPIEEFDNIIKTGIFAPIKMTESTISKGHKEAMGKPIGTITQLAKFQNKIIALAALWKRERPDDIDLLKKMYEENSPPNVSWELSYAEIKEEDNGVKALQNISLNGLCVVSSPAYSGRTPFVAMASEDSTTEEENLVNEEELKQKISELESEIQTLKESVSAKDTELDELRKFKQDVDAAKQRETRLAEIKQKFTEAKLDRDVEYWNQNAETLLKLDDATLDFMIQELVAFTEASASTIDSKKKEIPNFQNKSKGELTPRELGKALRESKLK